MAASPGTAFTNTVEVEGEIGVLQANDTASATFNEVAVPVAEDDSVLGVIVGTAVTLDVLDNDPSGANLDPSTVMITDPANGLAVTLSLIHI